MRIAETVNRLLPGGQGKRDSAVGGESFAELLQNAAAAKSRPSAQSLGAAANPLASTGSDGKLNLDDLRSQADRLLAGLSKRLQEQLESAGVDTSQGIALKVDAQGKIRSADGHRLAPQIEAALADDPSLAREFNHWAGLQGALNAADRHMEFREAYAADPQAAVQKYADLLSNAQQELTLRVGSQGAQVGF
jgi:DNA topoisomerase IB